MNAYGQNILQLLPADSLQFFNQAHKISVLLMEEILHHFQRPTLETSRYCLKTQWSKICASDGNPAPPVNMLFNFELGGTGVQVMH